MTLRTCRGVEVADQNVARLSEVIEDQYTATVAALRLAYTGRVRGYAYDSPSDANFESNFSGRAYPDTESFRFVCVAPVNANTFGLMQHEANHVFVVNGLGRAGTYFMTEGLATALVSERPDRLRAIVGASSSEFASRIALVYGRSLDSLEEDWIRFCDSWVG